MIFGLFKKKTQEEKLQAKYDKLMKQAFQLSRIDRAAGDAKYAEADEILKRIKALANS